MKNVFWWFALLVVLGGVGAAFYYWQKQEQTAAAPAAAPASPPSAPAGEQHPVPAEANAKPLPTLSDSDSAVQEALGKLIGADSLASLFNLKDLIRRIVVTVDNLPREKLAQRLSPFKPVAGEFKTARNGGGLVIGADNAGRYTAYVKLAQEADTKSLVAAYRHFYPLFQQAYVDLGYPNGHFNDRLIEAIDSLLAAPDLPGPLQLARPSVLYVYDDAQLESLPVGQKILVRMGSANADVVKAKLREIRGELTAQAPVSK